MRRTALIAAAIAAIALVPWMPASAATPGPCPLGRSFDQAVAGLRICGQDQLDALYRVLRSGPMPAYGSAARGYWRWSPDAHGLDQPLNFLTEAAIWQGKVFYTTSRGGVIYNRVGADREDLPARVYYGAGRLDGRSAIIVDYASDDDVVMDQFFRDEIRQVLPGLYLGIGWWHREPPGWVGPDRITFILDFKHPDIPPSTCPQCALLDRAIGPGHP